MQGRWERTPRTSVEEGLCCGTSTKLQPHSKTTASALGQGSGGPSSLPRTPKAICRHPAVYEIFGSRLDSHPLNGLAERVNTMARSLTVPNASGTELPEKSPLSIHSTIALPRSRSPTSVARIRTKNRRKRYLDLHPDYFSSALELAGLPLPCIHLSPRVG